MLMRVVGLNNNMVFIQRKGERRGEWKQEKLNFRDFENLVKREYLVEFEEYLASDYDNIGDFFYEYKETDEMKRKGIAHIFKGLA